jgi:sugar lactone lactonase YvrE
VSDSEAGTLWRIPAGGSAELWLQHALLEGTGETPGYPPIGANGIAYWQNSLYVANLEQGTVLRIPILKGGEAGDPEIIAERRYGLDGICVDLHGRIYAALGIQSKVIQIDPADGTITELATRADGLDIPASLAFGIRQNENDSLFVSNYAVSRFRSEPGVIRLDLGVPGYPLP